MIALLVLLFACTPDDGQGTDTGNAFTADLVIGGEGLAISTEVRDVELISVARMNIAELEFAPCTSGEEDELEYPGPFAIDLRDPAPLPEVELAYDTVCEFEFYMEPSAIPDDPVDDLTLYVEGRTELGTNFTVASTEQWEFEIEEEIAMQDALNRFLLLFDTDLWFEGLDIDGGTGDPVVIDAANNPGLLAGFEANVQDSARLELEDD